MPKRLESWRPVASGNLLRDAVLDRWECDWAARRRKRGLPVTITTAAAAWLVIGAIDPGQLTMPERCTPPPDGAPDDPRAPGRGAPLAVRHLAAAMARDPDECIDFLRWVRATAAKVDGTALLKARTAVQQTNLAAAMRRRPWRAKQVDIGPGDNSMTIAAAIRIERQRARRRK